MVLQSFYFQCNWWRLFQKPVVFLNLIFTFLLWMLFLNLLKLSTIIHVDSDYFISRFSNKYCLFFDLSLVRRGSVISPLPSYWVVVPNNFSFIMIRWADVFAMNINSKCLLQFIYPLFNRFFQLLFHLLFYLLFDNRWYVKCSMQPKYKQTYNINMLWRK